MQKFTIDLPITMLTGERTTIPDNQFTSLLHKIVKMLDAVSRMHIKTDVHMNTTLTKVTIVGPSISIAFDQRAKIAQIVTQFFRGHRRIFPTRPGQLFA